MEGQDRYAQLVELLSSNETVEVKSGYELIIKPIPDVAASGVLDPRVYEVSRQRSKKRVQMSEMSPDAPDVMDQIQRMRAAMGWDNTDVTKTPITKSTCVIKGSNGPIPLHIYTPESEGELPAVVFIHGGGFIGGSTAAVENPCKALAEKAGAVVISVDYRLAPEYPFPAGLTDCFDAVKWVHQHAAEIRVNPQQIAISGDSAGGNLATVCTLMDIEQGTNMIKFQALLYPSVNMQGVETDQYQWDLSHYEIGDQQEIGDEQRELILQLIHGLKGSGKFIHPLYFQNRVETSEPHVSPLLSDQLGKMPPTLIALAQYDFLTVEGEAYGAKLARLGVPVRIIRYNGTDHAFMDKIGLYPQAEDVMNEIAQQMNKWLR